jgi:hypothetical protein
MLEHIINCLLMDLFMMWYLCQINQGWHKVMGNTVLWYALEIVKYPYVSYHWTIVVAQGLLRCSFKQ